MQIICYLTIYTVPLPANTSIYMVEFTKLIEFTVLNPDSLIQAVIGDPEFKLVNLMSNYIKSDGALSMADDLSFYLLVLLVCSILMLTLCVVSFAVKRLKAIGTKLLRKIIKKFLFNGMIRSITIAYIKLCISFGSQVKEVLRQNKEQTTSDKVIGISMFVVMFGYPFISLYAVIFFESKLDTIKVRARISNFYQQIDLNHGRWSLAFYTIFLIRRIVFVAIPTFIYFWPWLQLQTLLFMTSMYIVYYGGTRPHLGRQRVRLEVFNEVMTMVIHYHMVCFTDFNNLAISKYYMGYSFVFCILFLVLFNLILLGYNQLMIFRRRRAFQHKRKVLTTFKVIDVYLDTEKSEEKQDRQDSANRLRSDLKKKLNEAKLLNYVKTMDVAPMIKADKSKRVRLMGLKS